MIRIAHISTVDLTLRFLLLPELQRLRDEGFDVTAISAPGPWVEQVEAAGIRHIPWPHATRAWDLRADAAAFRELLGILRRERFDLVHTHTPKAAFLGRIAARRAGVRCVVNTVHGFYAQPTDRLAKKLGVLGLEGIAARASDLELYSSAEDLEWARRLRLGESARRVHCGGGIDLDEFDPARVSPDRRAALRKELGIAQDAVVVGTVCRLVAEKGVRELLQAADALASEQVRFLVVGPDEPDKPDAIREDELARAAAAGVVFTGLREDVRDLYAAMDVFVLASWREGLPGSAIEALAMGKPLVLTDIRGSLEVARDGVEALVVPPRDAGRLTEAIRRLVADPELRSRLGAAARARAVERFDRRKALDLIVAEYRRLLGRKGLLPASNGSLLVRPAFPEELPEIARLHRETLPAGFMSRLGERFLRRFYRALLEDDRSFVVVADDGGAVAGFAAAALSMREFSRRFYVRHGLPAALAAAGSLVRAGVPRGMLETAKYASRSDGWPDAEFISLGVARSARRAGAGRMLAEETLARLRNLGATEVRLFTPTANDDMSRFWIRLGLRPSTQTAVHRGVPSTVWIAVLAAVGIALAAGLLDDARPQPARVQAVLQISAGIALVAGGIDLEPLGAAGPFAVVLLVVAGANGVNFVDGQDGLAGGLAALACLGLAGLAAAQADLALALAGALGAFLLWNRSPARIFLGNGGAQAVGTILAVLAIGAIDAGGWRGLVAASVCLTIFLFELVLTVIRRLGSRSLTTGDRLHSYDLLAEELGSRGRVTLAFWALGAAASAVALAVSEVPMTIAITTAVAVWGCSAVAGYLLWSRHSTGKAPRVRARRARSYVG